MRVEVDLGIHERAGQTGRVIRRKPARQLMREILGLMIRDSHGRRSHKLVL